MKTPKANMRLIFFVSLIMLLTACADLGYYWHSVKGHLSVMNKRVDIETLLRDPETDPGLKQRLQLVKEIRQFSVEKLAMPDSGSYGSYVQLEHAYVLQNLFAAPEFSTKLISWCYPIAGCASYRGYYEQQRLDDFVQQLEKEKHDIYIGRVPAYSTLGWFDDPVLSSFIDWPDYRLAGLLFHELTHQKIYIDDDTRFNESLASAVQQVGIELWLSSRGMQQQLDQFHDWIEYKQAVVILIERIREDLTETYHSEKSDDEKRREKQKILQLAAEQHRVIAESFGIQGGYTNWFASNLNNAKLGSISTYNSRLPIFVSMIHSFDNDFTEFFNYVETLAEFDKSKRDECLNAWSQANAIADSRCL